MIDISQLIAEFGAYFKAGGQNVKDIRKKLLVQSETDSLFHKRPTTDTVLQGGKVQISNVLQGYQDQFTKYGNTTFTGRKIFLHPLKIDWEENPTLIWNSWIGFLASSDISRKDWPIVKYIIDELIMPKAKENWELQAVYNGKLEAIVPGTPQSADKAVNGIKELINIEIDASTMEPIVVGAVPADNVDFVDYVEEFVDGIPKHVRPFLQPLAMSETLETRFRRGMRTKYNTNYEQAGSLVKVMDTNLEVKGFRSHEGSTKIWTTIKGNAELAVKNPANENVFKVEEAKRVVSVYTDYWKGMGFWMPEEVYTNDVELPV